MFSRLCILLACLPLTLGAQARPSTASMRSDATAHAVVLIVTDGLRWQELFSGADSALISRRPGGVQGSKFSYPGYNEMLTGAADRRIDKNDFGPNPNVTVFEWLNGRPALRSRVAAFATWGVFNAIFNTARAQFPLHAGWGRPPGGLRDGPERTLDRLFRTTTRLWEDNSYDAFMQTVMLEHVRSRKPRVLFVGYGETDEFAHMRRYDLTLRTARSVDGFIAELWHTMQLMPEYRGRTTFIVTTDHGRGTGEQWTDHGEDVVGAEQIWIAMSGPGVPRLGEIRGHAPVTQSQIAATIAALLGERYSGVTSRAALPLLPVSR